MTSVELVEKAKDFAQKVHSGHSRLSGENYFWHLHRVAELLEQNGVTDPEIIAGAYLHHVLDLDSTNKQTLLKEFGPGISDIVSEYKRVSDNEISSISPKDYNENVIVQTYLNLIKNPKTLIVRLADKVDNIRSAYVLPKESAKNVAEKAIYLYSPICQLLGLHGFVAELENEAFKILNPGKYYSIAAYLKKKTPEIEANLSDAVTFVSEILTENNIEARIDYRVKHIYSIYKKAVKYHETKGTRSLEKIYDIAAMRILVNTVEECYKTEDLLKQAWKYLTEERDDYINKPKPSGYQSIHNTFVVTPTLNVEVQIKTKEMHEINEYGIASHTFYKTGEKLKKTLQVDTNWVKQMSLEQNNGTIDIGFFNKYVYVFTPKGDIKQLPRGANLIDFAYSIHKDLGNACVGGTVNGDFQKLTYELKDGDRVEIKVLKHKKVPSSDWIDLVKTRKAKEEIRKALRNSKEKNAFN